MYCYKKAAIKSFIFLPNTLEGLCMLEFAFRTNTHTDTTWDLFC